MTALYKKSELTFTLVWVGAYCFLQSAAFSLNRYIGVAYAANAGLILPLAAVLLGWIRKNGLMERYGLCRPSIPARRLLWYVPLGILASVNLWNGVTFNLPPADTACYVCCMLCVGFVEEVLFRGFLFRAIERDSGVRTAAVVSSATFGLGHLINLINGRGMALAENLHQVAVAILLGFLFVLLFRRSGSLLPCAAAHAAINVSGGFAVRTDVSLNRLALLNGIWFILLLAYTLFLLRRPPEDGQ